VTVTTLRQFHRMALALLVMTGRVTMLGLSRWAGHGGSDRTVPRLFSTVMPWATLFGVFFHQQVYRPGDVDLLAGDEVVVTKAGQHPHGLDRFFASLYRQPGPGLAFFTRSLVVIVQGVGRSDDSRWQTFFSQGPVAGSPQPGVIFRSTPPCTWYTHAALTMPCRLFEDLISCGGTRPRGGGDRP
jgi:DDE superfamily endonuclease